MTLPNRGFSILPQQFQSQPAPQPVPQSPQNMEPVDEEETVEEAEERGDNDNPTELSDADEDDVFGVDNEDVMGNEDGDLSDVFDVPESAVMGGRTPPRRRKIRRTNKRYIPPPSMGGMQY